MIQGKTANPLPGYISISNASSHRTKKWENTGFILHDFVDHIGEHKEGLKEGTVWSAFRFKGNIRNSTNALSTQLAVFDCDNGEPYEDIATKIERKKLAAIIVSTHSHLTTHRQISLSEWKRWRKANPDGSAAMYLSDQGYHHGVFENAELATLAGKLKIETIKDQQYVTIKHAPCPKFRVIFFAKSLWRISNYATRAIGQQVYKDGLIRLAKDIGLTIDRSGIDLARLFFYPRHRQGAEYVVAVLDGGPVNTWSEVASDEIHSVSDSALVNSLKNKKTNLSLAEFENAVLSIKNDERFDRNEYVKVAAAIKMETDGSEDGFALFDRWTQDWIGGQYDPGENRRVWDSLNTDRDGSNVTGSTVLWLAERDGWVSPNRTKVNDLAPHGDIWNGQRFAEETKGELLYVAATKLWMRWQNPRWAELSKPGIERIAKKVSANILDECHAKFRQNPNIENKALSKIATNVHSSLERVRKIAESASSEPGMFVASPADFDRDPEKLCVENGVLDLRTGVPIPVTPDQRFAKMGGTSFDAQSTAPQFANFLETVQPDPEIRSFIQTAVGYSLTGLIDEEVLFFLYGTGANGKSVFANILSAVLGEFSVTLGSAIIAKNKHENEAERLKARLPGMRLALVNETAQGDIWDDQRVKELASREKMSARLLHKEAFDFLPTHKLWIRGNHLPGVFDSGDGFWRRMVPINFGVQIEPARRIPDLDRRIIGSELPGVLNWALAGCQTYFREGLLIPKSISSFVDEYRGDTDLLGQWVAERCINAPGARTSATDVYSSYCDFCKEEGISPMSKALLGRTLTSKGFKRSKDTGKRGYLDFQLRGGRVDRLLDESNLI